MDGFRPVLENELVVGVPTGVVVPSVTLNPAVVPLYLFVTSYAHLL
jgi:hypothetical protein